MEGSCQHQQKGLDKGIPRETYSKHSNPPKLAKPQNVIEKLPFINILPFLRIITPNILPFKPKEDLRIFVIIDIIIWFQCLLVNLNRLFVSKISN